MNKVERVKEFYNNGQDEWFVWKIFVNSKDEKIDLKGFINENIGNIYIRKKENKESGECIGFYEWLFNPKYKVWQVFNFPLQAIIELGKNEESFIVKGIKQPEEILTYLADRSIE
jgi:hypothetical protein